MPSRRLTRPPGRRKTDPPWPRRSCGARDRKSTRLNSSHSQTSYAVFCLKKKIREKEDVLFLVIVSLLETYAREIPVAIASKTDPLDRFCAAHEAYCRAVGRNVGETALD